LRAELTSDPLFAAPSIFATPRLDEKRHAICLPAADVSLLATQGMAAGSEANWLAPGEPRTGRICGWKRKR